MEDRSFDIRVQRSGLNSKGYINSQPIDATKDEELWRRPQEIVIKVVKASLLHIMYNLQAWNKKKHLLVNKVNPLRKVLGSGCFMLMQMCRTKRKLVIWSRMRNNKLRIWDLHYTCRLTHVFPSCSHQVRELTLILPNRLIVRLFLHISRRRNNINTILQLKFGELIKCIT
jgi:hypothetical protein